MGTGNTVKNRPPTTEWPVHPRGHGEHEWTNDALVWDCGSSPWARGTLLSACDCSSCWRFIPVGTGNTLGLRFSFLKLPVHPRGHGEHSHLPCAQRYYPGSSPWARGTLDPCGSSGTLTRFIPVGTGNTINCTCSLLTLPVHPRGHGEHLTEQQLRAAAYGSSPWARGTRFLGS